MMKKKKLVKKFIFLVIFFGFFACYEKERQIGKVYEVWGGEKYLSGPEGFHPEKYNYTLLGTAESTRTFYGNYQYYLILTRPYNIVYVDAIMFSDGHYHGGPSTTAANTLDWINIFGAPDGAYAAVGGGEHDENEGGYISIDPGDYFDSITVFIAQPGIVCGNLICEEGEDEFSCQIDCPSYASMISAGGHHNCALTSNGGVKCWGYNYYGQLGDGTYTNSNVPVVVFDLIEQTSFIALGENHSCALLNNGQVKCWGENLYGQLGVGSTVRMTSSPVDVLGGASSEVAVLCAGGKHTCALLSSGKVKCWGANYSGQLGNGTNTNSNFPVYVLDGASVYLSSVVDISCGGEHTCALLSNGQVKCWGTNYSGQLGNGASNSSNLPVDVLEGASAYLSGVIEISCGGEHTCALLSNGQVKCWGSNGYGQLGDGSNSNSPWPINVLDGSGTYLSGVIDISAGYFHTCAVMSYGGVKCWGWGGYGQLGQGSPIWLSNLPLEVKGLSSSMISVSAGRLHTCALSDLGGIKCWGGNSYGQVGNGSWWDTISMPAEVFGFIH